MDANHNRAWLLGAEDPEMVAIEKLLREAGETVAHAMAGGARVTPANAYRADAADASVDCDGTLYLIECGLAPHFTAAIQGTVIIDHHRPGDPGYGCGPEKFMSASSLGQVLLTIADLDSALLLAPDLALTAAADHCLAAAYAGKCPGVDPTALRKFREQQLCYPSRASNRGELRTVEQVRESINAALRGVVAAPRIVLGGVEIADCRGAMIPDLPEAAMIAQLGYLAGGVPLREGERAKVVIGGCGAGTAPGEEPVRDFLSRFVAEEGLVEGYGDSARGFAGAYLP